MKNPLVRMARDMKANHHMAGIPRSKVTASGKVQQDFGWQKFWCQNIARGHSITRTLGTNTRIAMYSPLILSRLLTNTLM